MAESEDARIARKLEWFQDQKLGFFTHWGVYSQWGCIESWPLVEEDKWARPADLKPWVDRDRGMERFKRDYWDLNHTFNPARFDPAQWAEAAKEAGMRYFVFTTKHHDGFNMFNTKQTSYRVTDPSCPFSTNPRANVAKQLFEAFRAKGLGIGAYYSKADWHHSDYWDPGSPARTRNPNYDTHAQPEKWARFVSFVHKQIEELVTGYGKVDILWLDAGQVRPPDQDLQMDRLAAMARSHQPDLLVVDRTVGGRYENYRTPEQEVPDKPLPYPWESCITLGDQWSYKPNDRYKSTAQLIHLLVDVVAKGGNLLLNVGPQPDGQLPGEALKRMREMGAWLKVNGEAIYGTRPIAPYREGSFAYTRKGTYVYAIYLPPAGAETPPALPRELSLASLQPAERTEIRLLGWPKPLTRRSVGGECLVALPEQATSAPTARHGLALRMESI